MHDSSERRPGRPSLLSADQAPAPNDLGVLSQLDGRSAPRSVPVRGAPPSARGGRGARGLLALVALAGLGTMGWLTLKSSGQSPDATLAAAHVPAPRPAAAPVAVPLPSAPAAPPVLQTAAIIQDEPAPKLPEPAPARAGKDDLASLLDQPAAAKPRTPAPRAPKPAPSTKPKVAQKTAPAKAPAPVRTPRKTTPSVDTDAALLAALLAHTKAPEAGSPEEIYKRCATNATAAEVQRCRVRVCQSSAKSAAECKTVRISKVSS